MAAWAADPPPIGADAWHHAPCMLVELDGTDRVVAVNERFLERTGYKDCEVLGRVFWDEFLSVGSRIFYQTQLAPVLELDRWLEEVMVDLRSVTGTRVPALMNVARRVSDSDEGTGTSVALLGVPDRRAFEDRLRQARDGAERAQRQADQARDEAEQARRESEAARAATERALEAEGRARLRLELLAQANSALASSVDIDLALNRLSRVLTTRLADWCLIHVPDPDQPTAVRWSAAHTDPNRQADTEVLAELLLDDAEPESSLRTLLRVEAPTLLSQLGGQELPDTSCGQPFRAAYSSVGVASVIAVPIAARRSRVATILLGRGSRRPAFSNDDLADISDVAARTGIAVDNLRRQAREHSNSIALQHALLTTPPKGTGFEIATRYQPATNGNDVGGDWYDAFLQPDGALVLVIGDVIGHDIQAAAAMGQLRGIVRTLAYTTARTPADILTQADHTAVGLGVDILATALVARLETSSGGSTTVQWSNAGHPPGLLITEGGIRPLTGRHGRLLGLPANLRRPRHDHSLGLRPGDTLVLYTDGLVERTDETIDQSIATLAASLETTRNLDHLCDLILKARTSNIHDDIALIVVRVPAR